MISGWAQATADQDPGRAPGCGRWSLRSHRHSKVPQELVSPRRWKPKTSGMTEDTLNDILITDMTYGRFLNKGVLGSVGTTTCRLTPYHLGRIPSFMVF